MAFFGTYAIDRDGDALRVSWWPPALYAVMQPHKQAWKAEDARHFIDAGLRQARRLYGDDYAPARIVVHDMSQSGRAIAGRC